MNSSKMFKTLLVLALSICCSFGYADDLTVEKRRDIEELLFLSSSQLSEQMVLGSSKQWVSALKRQHPNIAEEPALRVIQRELEASKTEVLLNLYNKYFSAQEIRETVVFMKSSTGRKYNTVLPSLLQDLAISTQQASLAINIRVLTALQKEGIISGQRANPSFQGTLRDEAAQRP